jgi:DNA modification methylase
VTVSILVGDCRELLKGLPDESVHCVVTSPPYWGLRDYGTAKWEGGDTGCDHRQQLGGEGGASAKQNTSAGTQTIAYRDNCGKCGARRIDAQLGLEPTPQAYVENMVAVFREVRRVLRDDGTLWLNLGDSYNSIGHKKSGSGYGSTGLAGGIAQEHHPLRRENTAPGLKHKDLVGIPWRVAFALQADGWYLRQDIIWAKPNPMPESVRDRCTKAHEYLFLLAKSEQYFYDAEAIKEPVSDKTHARRKIVPAGWAVGEGAHTAVAHQTAKNHRKVAEPGSGVKNNSSMDAALAVMPDNRNKRSVWTVPSAPFPEAHFATFPPALIEPCILAGSPPRGVVLDPFGGAGTTGLVADRLQRDAIIMELNPEYVKMATARITGDAPLFAEVVT